MSIATAYNAGFGFGLEAAATKLASYFGVEKTALVADLKQRLGMPEEQRPAVTGGDIALGLGSAGAGLSGTGLVSGAKKLQGFNDQMSGLQTQLGDLTNEWQAQNSVLSKREHQRATAQKLLEADKARTKIGPAQIARANAESLKAKQQQTAIQQQLDDIVEQMRKDTGRANLQKAEQQLAALSGAAPTPTSGKPPAPGNLFIRGEEAALRAQAQEAAETAAKQQKAYQELTARAAKQRGIQTRLMQDAAATQKLVENAANEVNRLREATGNTNVGINKLRQDNQALNWLDNLGIKGKHLTTAGRGLQGAGALGVASLLGKKIYDIAKD